MTDRTADRGQGRVATRQSESLQDYAYRLIRDRVLSHADGPGELLRESELAATLGVSRTPVRGALEELEADGLLRRIRGAGFAVVQVTPKVVADIFQVRLALETSAARNLASGRGQAERWARLEELLSALTDVSDDPTEDHLRIAQEADRFVHREIIAASGNDVAIELAERIELRLGPLRSITRRERRLGGARGHLMIVRKIRAEDYEGAAALLETHLSESRDYLIGLMARSYPSGSSSAIPALAGELHRDIDDDDAFNALLTRIRSQSEQATDDAGQTR